MRFIRTSVPAFILCAVIVCAPLCNGLSASAKPHSPLAPSTDMSGWTADSETGAFIYYDDGGTAMCRPATSEETAQMRLGDRTGMKVIERVHTSSVETGDITIVLQGTAQLDGFPAAKNGFLAAVDHWKQRIHAPQPITIIVDVDFGPTNFGTAFQSGVLGATDTQSLINSQGYSDIRSGLIAAADTSQESALVNSLPTVGTGVPTDIGSVSGFVAPSALLRTLGIINAVADPPSEGFGDPPSIGFNSNFEFDFDPSNGIDADKIDFDAVATHEIGHALGFTSRVGQLEQNPSATRAVTVWDLFRFRPGVTMNGFMTTQRILSSGGQQIFFDGGSEVPVSTGRPNGTGGDGFQGSHWKNNTFTGFQVGIMDPAIARGERQEIGDNDLRALDAFGYGLGAGGGGGDDAGDPGGPVLKKVSYNGAQMTIKGDDFSGNLLQLEVNGVIVAPPARIKVKGSGSKLKITGTQSELHLVSVSNRVRVIQDGKRSAIVLFDL